MNGARRRDVAAEPRLAFSSYGTSSHGLECGCTRCRGFKPGNSLSLRHGAHSDMRVNRVAVNQKRAFLRQNGLRKRDVDGVGLALLDAWSRAAAKVFLMDAWFEEHGFLDGEGVPFRFPPRRLISRR